MTRETDHHFTSSAPRYDPSDYIDLFYDSDFRALPAARAALPGSAPDPVARFRPFGRLPTNARKDRTA